MKDLTWPSNVLIFQKPCEEGGSCRQRAVHSPQASAVTTSGGDSPLAGKQKPGDF